MFAIFFALLHPSALYAPFLPLLMIAFFSAPKNTFNFFGIISKTFVIVTTLFLGALIGYQLYFLILENSLLKKWKST